MNELVAILFFAFYLIFRGRIQGMGSFPLLRLEGNRGRGYGPGVGIHARIQAQVKLRPNDPLDYTSFPRVPYGNGDYYAFGARLFHADRQALVSGDWQIVPQTVLAVRSGRIRDWKVLEANLKEVDRLEHRQTVMDTLQPETVTRRIGHLFREVAIRSDNYNAVAWGIALGCVAARQADIEDLLPLGRHSELSGDVIVAVLEQSSRFPELRRHINELLPHLYDWGLLHFVLTAVNNPDQLPGRMFGRDILVLGMKNGGALKGDIARILLDAGWVRYSTAQLLNDDELRRGVARWIEAVTSIPEPPGHIALDTDGRKIVEGLLSMVRPWPGDFAKVMALRAIGLVFGAAEELWSGVADHLEEIHRMVLPLCTVDRIGQALDSPETRATALIVAAEIEMNALAGRVVELVRQNRDPLAAEVVAIIGERSHLRQMERMLPEIVDISRRVAGTREGEKERESEVYAGIVAALGYLGTASATTVIKRAASDFHPIVRGAAMVALHRLQRWTLDNESKRLIRKLLDDPFEGVRGPAREAAAFHTMFASLAGTPHKGTLTFDLPKN